MDNEKNNWIENWLQQCIYKIGNTVIKSKILVRIKLLFKRKFITFYCPTCHILNVVPQNR